MMCVSVFMVIVYRQQTDMFCLQTRQSQKYVSFKSKTFSNHLCPPPQQTTQTQTLHIVSDPIAFPLPALDSF